MALLGLLLLVQKKYSLKITVAHLDHGLQRSSGRAARLVRSFCKEKNLPFVTKKVGVARLAKQKKLSLEDAGRRARYAFFSGAAKKYRAKKIATAHTLDDQAETVLMRLLRGSGLRGLAGIPYERAEGGRVLVRPLLDLRKKELLGFARARRLPFLRDRMNRDPRFLRNRVRHELLPLLRRFNPRMEEALASLQKVHADLRLHMEHQARAALRRSTAHVSKKEIRLSVARLRKLPSALRHETLLTALIALKGDGAGFGYSHIRSLSDLLEGRLLRAETHLPHGLRAIRQGSSLRLCLI